MNQHIPYDPDFDGSSTTITQRPTTSVWDKVSARNAFFGGLLLAILSLCTLGFLILVVLFMNRTQ